MFWAMIHRVMSVSPPGVRRFFWHWWYDTLSKHEPGFTFMNYGYACTEADGPPPRLDLQDAPNRYAIQLYHHLLQGINTTGCDILEVASGRGGGAAYVVRNFMLRSFLGIDASPHAVAFCNRTHCLPGLEFRQGYAERLPVGDAQFDAVICVEASRCFGSLDDFLREARRALRSGGHLLYCDLRPRRQVASLRAALDRSGLELMREQEITPQVLAALAAMSDERKAWVASVFPGPLVGLFASWAGVKGHDTYEALRCGETRYLSFVLRKPV